MKVRDVFQYMDKFGYRGSEERILFGNADQEVSAIAVCWMPTIEVIKKAAEIGCNLIICHENLTFPYNFYTFGQHLENTIMWKSNMERLSLLIKHNISVIRGHATIDHAYIGRCFEEAIGMTEKDGAKKDGNITVIEKTTLEELARDIKRKVKLDTIRVTGDLKTEIQRVGFAIGGVGISVNMGALQKLVESYANVIITGEADEESLRFAVDSGVCVIETSHIAYEEIGLEKFAKDLGDEFNGIVVIMVYGGIPWTYIL